ncbi:MAG: DUF1858 domain-containing protein [Clostridiaceae bacterium]|nr:DUF1858 domain-containing protein [Clostridiaceae bacterium]
MKATKEMLILDLLQLDPNLAELLMGHGLHCIGCMLASNESIEQACVVHGISVDGLLEDINSYLESSKKEKTQETGQ